MHRTLLGLILTVLLPGGLRASDFVITTVLGESDKEGGGGKVRVVAAPTIVTKSGDKAELLVGGQVTIGGRQVTVGREVEITATRSDDGSIRVKVVFRLHAMTGASAPQVSTATKMHATHLRAEGGNVRVEMCDGKKGCIWADVTIRPAK